MKKFVIFMLLTTLFAGLLEASADNQAEFDKLWHSKFKKFVGKTTEGEFFRAYGKPSIMRDRMSTDKPHKLFIYQEPRCRFKFRFEKGVFKQAQRNCM